MDGQDRMPAKGRRSASRATKLRRRKQRINILLLAGAAAAIIWLVFVLPTWLGMSSPFTETRRASKTVATESGAVEGYSNISHLYDGLKISEVMSSNRSSVTDETGGYPDWVEIWNSSEEEINLKGVGLSDDGTSVKFLFPGVTLQPNGRVIVFCDNRNQASGDLPFHAKFKLSSLGESVYLYDPNAYLIDSVKYPIMASDESWMLTPEGFQNVTWFSPGYENTPEGHQAYRESITVTDGSVIINEVMADPLTGIRDDEDELADWIELYNTTDRDIQLNLFSLSDNEKQPLKWRFPDGAYIPAHGYYLVLCTGKDRADTVNRGVYHTNFRISAENETLILCDSQGHVVDRVMIDNLPQDASWGRNENNQMQIFTTPTPTLPNNQSGFNQMDLNLRALNKTGVWISEVLASNNSVATYGKAEKTDWIEIYNSSPVAVDLSDWGLSDDLGRGRKWQFPKGTVISPSEYKVIQCDKDLTKNTTAEPHTSFKIGRMKGETIVLTDPTGRVLDKVILPELKTDVSYGRTLGMAGLFYYDTPTPFQQNGTGFTGYAPQPLFSVPPGQYSSAQYVEISVPEGTQVFYTTDGSIPTQNSTPYKGERLELIFTSVIRARAFGTGMVKPSETVTGTYFISAFHSLPLVSVVIDPKNLWDSEWGMLTIGQNAIKEPGKLPFPNTVYRKVKDAGVKYEAHVELYDDAGNLLLNQSCEVGLMGDYSLDMPQKSFKFRSKSLYGSKTFNAKLFPDRTYTEYKGFVLRNSGNDSMFTRLQDGFQGRLMDLCNTTIAHQAWKPYAVYLNGQYWGHMNLRERTDKYMIAQFEGMTLDQADQIDLLQGNGSVKSGSNKAFKEMLKKIKAGNPAKNPEDLQYILDNVDADNLFEYMAFEMFFGNSDIGNTRFYRTNLPGSKWRWVLYDVDYGLYTSTFNSPWSYTKEKGMGQKNINNTIFLKLLSVPEYRDRYLTIYGKIFQRLTTDLMIQTLNDMVKVIEPEMTLHWDRWGPENDKMVISEVPTTVDGAYRYWEKRVERLRNVCRLRPTRLWEFTQDAFNLTNAQMETYFGPKPAIPPDAVQ
ncbi:MAG: lamin tail domain-containing protein [Clostridia bacterium]|nr:lamin tail domain-containing protein [Clostridia bacterium]